ncbi:hypothetical protein APY03_1119 [Variovorax sp. WDL1]|nr:hypothetical protein APY03_1119 [Variovorax sp. WDL1]
MPNRLGVPFPPARMRAARGKYRGESPASRATRAYTLAV